MQINGDEYIVVSRSIPRDSIGEVSFDICIDGSMKRYPISYFFDWKDKSVVHDHVTRCINDWIDTAKKFPFCRRKCICCKTRAIKGKIMCNKHENMWQDVVYTF